MRVSWACAWFACVVLAACGDATSTVKPGDPAEDVGQDAADTVTATDAVVATDVGSAPDVETAPDAGDDVADAQDTAALDGADSVDPDAPADADAAQSDGDALADTAEVTTPDDATATDDVDVVSVDAAADVSADVAADAPEAPCNSNADCLPTALLAPCQLAVCVAGTCGAIAASDGSACEDGDSCTQSDVCLGGQCTQGLAVNCDDGNPCTGDTCAQGGCAHVALSVPCDDGNICTVSDFCKGGACSGGQKKDCDDGNVCTDNACDATLGCIDVPNTAPCSLLDQCQTGAQCGGGACLAGAPLVCADGNPCTNDLCDPQTGLCQFLTTTTPCDDGDACTLGDLCQSGLCQPGLAKGCADASPCTVDSCDSATGSCVYLSVDVTCDDASACTINDTCSGGVCLPGASTDCDDANPCTNDTCEPETGCTHVNNSLACSVGDACELAQCQAGQCVTTGVKGCDDGNPCTVGTCIAPVGCVFEAVPDGATCGGSTACAGAATCLAGKCAPGAKTDCSDGNLCTDDHCDPKWTKGCFWLPNLVPCEDGDLCTGADSCSNGKCLPGTLGGANTNCDDGNVCTDDSCAALTGCAHVANAALCDDGNACTVQEKCTSGICQGGALGTCDDGNTCTIDACDSTTGACSWTAKVGTCDDANPCTVGEACSGAFCLGATLSCDDGNPCSADACNAATGVCSHQEVGPGVTCDDADACTSGDTCNALACVGASIAASLCSDGNVCTTDACLPADGSCTWSPAVSQCDDGNPCTVGDTCGDGACVAGSGALCDDGNPCTVDQCNPGSAACSYSPLANGAACDDGLACTASSACQNGFCAPTVSNCTLVNDSFDCGGPASAWTLPKPTNTTVVWAIDATPFLSNSAAHGCTLNYNDGTNYCGNMGFYCYVQPTLIATSPNIDASALPGMPRLAFDTWYQLDGPQPGGTGFGDGTQDVPLVVLRDVASNQILDQFLLSKSNSACAGQCQGVWRNISLDEPKVAGHVFRVELSLASPSNWGNQGKGWFIDNFKVSQEFVPEKCSNGIDDDGNGRIDCADPICAGQLGC